LKCYHRDNKHSLVCQNGSSAQASRYLELRYCFSLRAVKGREVLLCINALEVRNELQIYMHLML